MTTVKRGPSKRKQSARSLSLIEAARVREEVVKMHREFGSDAAVADIVGVGAVTLYRIRGGEAQAGRKVADAVAKARRVNLADLLAGKVPS